MAVLYVRSTDGNDSDNGSTWALAKATLAGALSAAAAGDTIYVSQAHAETNAAAFDLPLVGTISNPVKIICANDGAQPPTATATTATVSSNSGQFYDFFSGVAYIYGIEFKSGARLDFATISTDAWFDTCKFTLTDASAYSLNIGSGDLYHGHFIFTNCTFKFAGSGQGFAIRLARAKFRGGSIDGGGTIPTNLFKSGGASWKGSAVDMSGMDLSAMGSNTLIADMGGDNFAILRMSGCKLGASAVISATQTADHNIDVINCDSGATNYRHERYQKAGSQVVETTIVRTGGASDGTTPISWKIVTSSAAAWVHPFESMPMAIWNDTTAANRTVTVYGIWGGGAVPKNDDIWIEVTYPGSSATPLATINAANTKADILTTNADQGTDSSTWGGSTTAFKMSVTLSSPQPAMKGPFYITVKAAAASSTFYIDPKPVLT